MAIFSPSKPEAHPHAEEDIDLSQLGRQRDRLLEDSKPLIPDLSPDCAELFGKVADRLMQEGARPLDKAVSAIGLFPEPARKFRSALRAAAGDALLIGYGIGRCDAKDKTERGTGDWPPDISLVGINVSDPQDRQMFIDLATHIPNLTGSETVLFRMIAARIMRESNVQVPPESVVWDVVTEGEEGIAAVANHIVKRALLVGYGLARYDNTHHINREVTLRRKLH